ncbi:MAG: pirin family protein [Candidatus Marinimicrobia bacterium]|nr:pirin family protein [Candidatus Neomarinimicrobiota bacterium]MCF7922374.1 pirin family protein [Candidatus Neomarinimicrobiota bacterium]
MIKNIKPLAFMWETRDPFLFCVHHRDAYPTGDGKMGPAASLSGRNIGQDFDQKDGWNMYHGHHVPGFPAHPHRGFETVTVVLDGLVDHHDSAGATGRYGKGDVQWMTAGSGLQHAEMFPLVNENKANPMELFQIWLNLPSHSKTAKPAFKMLWSESIPVIQAKDKQGRKIETRLIAGRLGSTTAPAPAPDSWAADSTNQVAIWVITLEAEAEFSLPACEPGINRDLYFYEGGSVNIANQEIPGYHAVELAAPDAIHIKNGPEPSRILLLQGRPIGEPVARYGPFVMNSQAEIQKAFEDYRATQFGGWPWDRQDPVNLAEQGRFARYSDGSEEIKE